MSDLFLLLSRREPYGVVFAEALAQASQSWGALPPAPFKTSQPRGHLCASWRQMTAEGAAAAMLPLLEDSIELGRARAASREWASTHLGWARYALEFEAVFLELTAAGWPRPRASSLS